MNTKEIIKPNIIYIKSISLLFLLISISILYLLL